MHDETQNPIAETGDAARDALMRILSSQNYYASQSWHDSEVLASRWHDGNLVFDLDPEMWFGWQEISAQSVTITYCDAQVLRQEMWFDGPKICWLKDTLEPVEEGYIARIKGVHVWNGCESSSEEARAARITVLARDIQVHLDGKLLPPKDAPVPLGVLLGALSWNAPAEWQKAAKEAITTQPDFDLSPLILLSRRKDCWDNCAEILCAKDDETLKSLLPKFLEWLMDLNWPGALQVLDRLQRMRVEVLKPALEAVVRRVRDSDEAWMEWLAELIRNQNIRDALDADVLASLEAHLDC